MVRSDRIGFRSLDRNDYELLYRWLCNPEVARWWDRPASLEEVVEKYDPQSAENYDLRSYVILLDERPIGYIQAYDGDVPATAGIDLFIGEDAHRHRGLGAKIINSFVDELVFADPAITRCIVDPSPENVVAIAAYQKAGFRRVAEQLDPKTLVMEVERA